MPADLDRRTFIRLLGRRRRGTARRLLGRLSRGGGRRLARPATAPPTCAAGPSATPSSRPTRTIASRGWSTCAKRTRSSCGSIASACFPRPIRGSARSSSARAPSSRRWCWRCGSAASSRRSRSFPKASSRRAPSTIGRWLASPGPPRPHRRRDPLFDQLLRRHTAKVDYDTTRPVAAETLDASARRAGRPGRALRRDRRAGAPRRAADDLLGGGPGRADDAAHGDGKHPPDPRRPGRDRPPSRRHQPQLAVAAARRCRRRLRPQPAAGRGQHRLPADDGALRRAQPQRDGLRLAVDAAARRAPAAPPKSAPGAPTCGCS